MTLIIAVVNDKYAVLASDRRLTFPDGTVDNEETCKQTIFACNDAKVMIAYTGHATVKPCSSSPKCPKGTCSTGDCSTGDWIINMLKEASKTHTSIYAIINCFESMANAQHKSISNAIGANFTLEVVIVGFYYTEDKKEPKIWKISNLTNLTFQTISSGLIDKVGYIEFAGAISSVSSKKSEIIRLL
jgi:hypothetical protein